MKTIILPLALFVSAAFVSCKKDSTDPGPQTPPAEITYSSIDSMKLDAIVQNINPQFYSDHHNKVYSANSNKVIASYTEAGGAVELTFTDSGQVGYEAETIISFKGKSLSTIGGTYEVAANNDVCVQMRQFLGRTATSSSWVSSPGCEPKKGGVIQISYDATTQTLSGQITKLQYRFGVYLPSYFSGNPHGIANIGFLQNGGSTRTQSITFKYVRKR
jgi:hypothetical protein